MKIRLASTLQSDSIVDGEGIRTVVWTQGCPHNCPFCHNPQTHDFKGGFLEDIDTINEELSKLKGQDGITLSGGDPMVQPLQCLEIAKEAHRLGMNVWCYSGYRFEEIMENKNMKKLLEEVVFGAVCYQTGKGQELLTAGCNAIPYEIGVPVKFNCAAIVGTHFPVLYVVLLAPNIDNSCEVVCSDPAVKIVNLTRALRR